MFEDETKTDDTGGEHINKEHRGRTRFCKQCKFSCTDSKEFLQHQLTAHGSDGHDSKSAETNHRKSSQKTPPARKSSKTVMESPPEVKVIPEQDPEVDDLNNMDEDDDERRLVIAETDTPSHPTRSGNIQNRNYSCKLCDFTTNSGKAYLHHEKECHKFDIIIYECDLCDYATKYKQKLPRHRKLHFGGMDSELLLNSSCASDNNDTAEEGLSMDTSQYNASELVELDEEDKDEEVSQIVEAASISMDAGMKQPRKKRQEVDPAKYIKVVDDAGIKFACSMCANIYKWRKSLNKHWNEKHYGEEPDRTKPAPALSSLTLPLASDLPGFNKGKPGKYSNKFDGHSSNVSSPASYYMDSKAGTPKSTSDFISDIVEHTSQSQAILMPKIIGPFITDTAYMSAYPTTSTPSRQPLSEHNSDVLDLSQKYDGSSAGSDKSVKVKKEKSDLQDEPIDFSVKKEHGSYEMDDNTDMTEFNVANELLALQARISNAAGEKLLNKSSLQCDKCSFVAKTLVDYSSHMTLHLNKRAFKCAECQAHFSGIDDLNEHFIKQHAIRLQEHKEAIQKIPHGLQQTYHLLKMPLDAITNLSSQDLHATNSKQLKCNMCEFIAKWPAELQKHAVSHSEERPFVCMVCASTYKWKWDLVKHFEKSHHTLPNPYKRREHALAGKSFTPPAKSNLNALIDAAKAMQDIHGLANGDDLPPAKKRRLSDTDLQLQIENNLNNFDMDVYSNHSDTYSVDGNLSTRTEDENSKYSGHSQSISPNPTDIAYMESEEQMTEKQHQAIMSTVRQRLVMGPPKLVKTSVVDKMKNNTSDIMLPYKCSLCEYRARWPSEITQHMKNHSDEKPYHCPRCTYKSKWKWDVVKHLKRCGGGTVKDVIDTTKMKKPLTGPPNAIVLPQGTLKQMTPQPIDDISMRALPASGHLTALQIMNAQAMEDAMKMMVGSDDPKQPMFKSLINQGIYHCLECPFLGHSPAELRRHSLLHSEDKPFVCDVCGYCTRWKCDLKKHVKTYNHYSATQPQSEFESPTGPEPPQTNPSPTFQAGVYVYKCNRCTYATSKKHMYDIHMKIHGQQPTIVTTPVPRSSPNSNDKFRCKQCEFTGNDLSGFLQHMAGHNLPKTSNSGHINDPLSSEITMRTFNMKHRRKPVQQFQCPKCPYACFKKSGLELHSAMHEPRGEDALQCYYCDYNVFSKNLLIQHMRLHPEYNPNDCTEMFNEEEVKASYKRAMEVVIKSREADAIENAAKIEAVSKVIISGKYQCEWCDAVLPNVAHLYRHSKMAHITEILKQEMQMTIQLDENANHTPSVLSPESFNRSLNEAMDLSRLTQPMLDQGDYNNDAEERSTTPTKSRKSANPHKRSRSFQCTKCPFTAPNAVNYLRHMERHGSNCKHTCNFCDYSIDRMNLLYQHMKQVHGIQTKLDDEDMEFSQDSNDKHEFGDEDDVSEHHSSIMNAASPTGSMEFDIDGPNDDEESSNIEVENEQWWRGTSIFVCKIDGRKAFKCPNCSFHDEDAALTASHAKQCVEKEKDSVKAVTVQNHETRRAAARDLSPPKHVPIYGHLCTKCPFRGKSKELLQRHLEMHEYDGKYSCMKCDYSVDRMNLLHQHIRVHDMEDGSTAGVSANDVIDAKLKNAMGNGDNGEFGTDGMEADDDEPTQNSSDRKVSEDVMKVKKTICCEMCPFETNVSVELGMHFAAHGAQCAFICDYCSYSADRVIMVLRHRMLHSSEDDFDSTPPSDKFINMDATNNADSADDEGGERNSAKHECALCPYKSNLTKVFEVHSQMHGTKKKYICDHCNWSSDRINLIFQHRKVHANADNFDTSPEHLVFLNREYVLNGQVAASPTPNGLDKTKFACKLCPFVCNNKSNYAYHKSLHEVSSRYTCEMCSYSVDRFNLLAQHVRLHQQENVLKNGSATSKKSLKCSSCPFHANSQEVLDAHKKMHAAGKKYVCSYCDFSTDRQHMLHLHQRVHEDHMTSSDESDDHSSNGATPQLYFSSAPSPMEPTEDLKPEAKYQCDRCPYSVASKEMLIEHNDRHGAGGRFVCLFCDYSCAGQSEMTSHVEVHFPGKSVSEEALEFIRKQAEDSDNENHDDNNVESKDDLQPEETKEENSNSVKGTKVYVCQYCEREFEGKSLMLQHEKQHLLG